MEMEVGGALLAALSGLPCLLLLLLVVAALALRGRPTRSAFLGYRVARPAGSSSYSAFRDDDEPPLPAECCDRLAVAVYRRHGGAAEEEEPECAFCLSAVRDGDEVRQLRCRHVFHRACLDAWLVRPRATCPLCRDRLLPADPPRAACTAADDDDDGDRFVHDDDDGFHDLLSPSSPGSAYAHGGALWHVA